jgi:Sporulation and spore germination
MIIDMVPGTVQISLLRALAIAVIAYSQVACNQHTGGTQRQVMPVVMTDEARIAASVQKTLTSSPPAGYAAIPTGTALLSARIDGNKVVLDFNKALLQNGTGARLEDAIRQITNPLGELTPQIKSPDYRILIEGKPLTEFLP